MAFARKILGAALGIKSSFDGDCFHERRFTRAIFTDEEGHAGGELKDAHLGDGGDRERILAPVVWVFFAQLDMAQDMIVMREW